MEHMTSATIKLFLPRGDAADRVAKCAVPCYALRSSPAIEGKRNRIFQIDGLREDAAEGVPRAIEPRAAGPAARQENSGYAGR